MAKGFNPNRNRIYKKATHCKECEKSWEEVERALAGKSSMCRSCYNQYHRMRSEHTPREIANVFKIDNRQDIYKQKRNELRAITIREEWLKVLQRNLEDALKELEKIENNFLYDND